MLLLKSPLETSTYQINGVRRQRHLAEIPFTLEQLLNLLKRIFGEQIKDVRSGFKKKNSNDASEWQSIFNISANKERRQKEQFHLDAFFPH